MKNIFTLGSLILSLCTWSQTTFAALNPITPSISQNFPTEVFTNGGTYMAKVNITSNFPFTMVNPLVIEKNSNSPTEFQYNDQCTGLRLPHGQTCSVTIYLTPIYDGAKNLSLILDYGHDRVPVVFASNATGGGSNGLISGSVTTSLSSPLVLNTGSNWKFTFSNDGSIKATGVNISVLGAPSGYQTNCGSSLESKSSCYVQGTLTPNAEGSYTVSANYSYAQGPTVSESTTSSTNGSSGSLNCYVAQGFSPQTLVGSGQTITLICNNTSSSDAITFNSSTSGSFSGDGTYPNALTASASNNCNKSQTSNLTHGASCQLTGTYTAPLTAGETATISTGTISYSIGGHTYTTSVSTTTSIVSSITNKRTIHLVNNCNFPVWWGMVGGAVSGANPSSCPAGSTSNNGRCLYNGYAPTNGTYQLAATNGTATTVIQQTAASVGNILWSGLISASTKCSGNSCANNDCASNGGTSQCTAGFQQPATEAEFTFLLTGSGNLDTYDITQVNGLSMPMSMATNQTPSEYSCGTAGSMSAQGSLPAANYTSITPPTNMYFWVSNLGSCNAENTCSNPGQICGLAFNSSSNSFVKACGNFLGYWAANQICQTSPSFTSPFGDNFKCNLYLSSPFPNNVYTLTQLLKCSPPNSTLPLFNSCYGIYTGQSATSLQQCCGCTNWSGIASPSQSCPSGQVDSQWTDNMQPLITWKKSANPTGYSYPYDDEASTFKCTADQSTEYTITFCPGNQNALPSGKTDDRS